MSVATVIGRWGTVSSISYFIYEKFSVVGICSRAQSRYLSSACLDLFRAIFRFVTLVHSLLLSRVLEARKEESEQIVPPMIVVISNASNGVSSTTKEYYSRTAAAMIHTTVPSSDKKCYNIMVHDLSSCLRIYNALPRCFFCVCFGVLSLFS